MDVISQRSFSTHTFPSICEIVVKVAKEAGEIIMGAMNTNTEDNVHLKGRVDLVTDTGMKVEAFIISTLTTQFPTSLFLAEEEVSSANGNNEVLSHYPTWIIDPIDGTTNFVHKYPVFCVSIALAIEKEIVLGVVYNPILNELFTATKGGGSFLNGTPIHVANASSLDKCVISTNIGIDRTPEGAEFLTQNLRKLLLNNVQSTRSGGSAAWEMSSVACGRLDAFYERGIHSWDIAAASLLVTEAGGVVAALDGSAINLLNRQVLCGNQNVVTIISDLLFSPSR